jgi:hypothetical protein
MVQCTINSVYNCVQVALLFLSVANFTSFPSFSIINNAGKITPTNLTLTSIYFFKSPCGFKFHRLKALF